MSSLRAAAASNPSAAPSRPIPQQAILALLVLAEIVIFSILGTHFFTWTNFFEVPRLSVELGLISLAMTPVIMTGGIDLSVGSVLGLCAVIFGKLWRDAHFSPGMAAGATLLAGVLAGSLNAALITRLRIPPLIVTLGSFSLFRGLAEGITRGVDNFTGFPNSFLYLGQGYFGHVPVQLPLLVIAAIGYWLLVHRSTIGRTLSAIGFAPEGARYAGIPVERRTALVYILAGFCSALAAVVYVARVGQAKADAGTGYELSAITAVVLGGTSIFGGRASIVGTLLGLFAIAILQNGLQLADQPPELAGILTGVLLLVAIGFQWRPKAGGATADSVNNAEELNMKNSQMAVLCIVILLAAGIILGGNYFLLTAAQQNAAQQNAAMMHSTTGSLSTAGAPTPGRQITIAMMPKSKGNSYFIACQQGAQEAASELGVKLLWDGPTDSDPAKQNEIVETWITRGVDVIAVSVDNREGLSTALRKARQAGIKVITWDADADPDARDFLVNQATPQGIGYALMDDAAQVLGDKGDFAIITASLTAANQNEWMKYIEERRAAKYPGIKLMAVRPCDDQPQKAFDEANTILNAHPDVKLIMAISSAAVPSAAEAVKQAGRTDVKVIGLGLPSENKKYIHEGITQSIVLWNTIDLGYLTVYAADALATGSLKPGDTSITAGRLGKMEVKGDNVLLGKPFIFTKDNVDQFNF
jgi:rhamnose transport system substrate-binding protein